MFEALVSLRRLSPDSLAAFCPCFFTESRAVDGSLTLLKFLSYLPEAAGREQLICF